MQATVTSGAPELQVSKTVAGGQWRAARGRQTSIARKGTRGMRQLLYPADAVRPLSNDNVKCNGFAVGCHLSACPSVRDRETWGIFEETRGGVGYPMEQQNYESTLVLQ